MPLQIIQNGTTNGWIPQIWAQEVLAHLRANIVMAPRVNRDYDTAIATYGNTVNVPLPLTLTAADAPDSGSTTVSAQSVSVELNKFKTVDVRVPDLFLAQSRPDVIANITRAAGIALAEAIENALLALYPNAAASVGTAGTDVAADTIRLARQKLVEAKVPPTEEKFVVLSPKDYAAILGDPKVTNALNYGGAEAIREGRAPTLYGMTLLESQLVPVVTGIPNTTYNLAFARDFAVLVTRPLPAPMDGTPAAIVRDDESGLTFRMVMRYDPTGKYHTVSIDVLFGVKAIRPEFAVQVRG